MRNTVGLDISAKTFDAVALLDGQTAYKKFQNNQDGIESLKNWINGQSIEDGQNIYIIMEATGNYYEAVADNLADYYHVSVINPLKIKRYADYRFNRTKTDKQDAKLIAEFGQNALEKDLPKHKRPSENIQSLKRLLSLQNQLKEQLTAQKNRLKAAKDSFVQQIHQKQIDELNQHLQDVDGQIKQTAKADKAIQETAKRLQTIPSVGQTTAIYLTVHLLTAHFKNANHFTAFAGMSPQQKKSGTSVNGKEKLTRYGNRKLRGALFMAAMVAMRQNYFPDFTKRLQKAKKPKMVIICALMRKLLVIAYHLHKNQTDFDPSRYKQA